MLNSQRNPHVHQQVKDKQEVAYLYNGTLIGHEKKPSTDTCYHTDEAQNHCAK